MKREQIIEILKESFEHTNEGCLSIIADKILALPIDVQIGLDCEIWRQKDRQYLIDKEVFTQGELDQRLLGRWEGLTWMKDEIINLNDTK